MFVFFLVSFLLLHAVNGFLLESPNCQPVKHFVLIHGSGHGAWSWYKLIALLKSSGHHVTAIDLAASGIDTRPAKTLRSISDYHRPLMDLMAALSPHEKVILVGHSLGGFAISQSMESFPDKISVAVFVTALMPGPSLNISFLNNEPLTNLFASLPDNESVFLVGHSLGGLAISHAMETFPSKIKVAVFLTALMPGLSLNASVVYQMELQQLGDPQDSLVSIGDDPNFPISITFGPKFLRTRLYQLSPIEDWTLATTVTRTTPLPSQEDFSSGKLDVTREKFGTVKRVFIMTEKDLIVTREYQEFMVKANPPDEVKEIFGSDHMVTNSKPAELSTTLLQIAEKY